MSAFILVLWGLVGWCGTPPQPRPSPRYPIAGIIGGVLGGLAVFWALGLGTIGAIEFVATAIGAFAGGRVLSDIVGFVMPEKSA
jgi:phage shock protein PspC (stress-responsive transcriptional regulator)